MIATGLQRGNTERETMVAVGASELEDVAALPALLGEIGVQSRLVTSVGELDELLRQGGVSAIFAHVSPSRLEFFSLLERKGMPPIVPLLSSADHFLYAAAVARGAFDCLPLSTPKAELERVLKLALEERGNSRWSLAGAHGAEDAAKCPKETEDRWIWPAREKRENEREARNGNPTYDGRAGTTNGFEQALLNDTRRPH